jgi:hypothetical protein
MSQALALVIKYHLHFFPCVARMNKESLKEKDSETLMNPYHTWRL